MQKPLISGIQQIGIGVSRVHEAWKWYRHHFGMDVPIFEEAATAALMLPYTGGEPRDRHAILALNMNGGGGFEIWQYTSRTPEAPTSPPQLGDYGIYIAKMKCQNIQQAFQYHQEKGVKFRSEILKAPDGQSHYYLEDPYGNLFNIVESKDWFQKGKMIMGAAYGALIGVPSIEEVLPVFQQILGYDTILFDETGTFEDWKALAGGDGSFRRMLLTHGQKRLGPFSRLLGSSNIELVEAKDSTPKSIYENRFWGDLGFIHLCFDIQGMSEMRQKCEALGYPFTVDSSNSFDMGEAAGHFSYIELPGGTLIEFVETHKIPIMKKWGWYLNLQKRPADKALPNWMLKMLGLGRVKD